MPLKRVLTLPLLTFYGTGMILGAGIYTIIGKAAGTAGESVWFSIILAALVATLAALSYAELSAMYPKVGGEYVYLRNAFPKLVWIANAGGLMVAFSAIATASTVALAFAGYLQEFVNWPPLLVAFSLTVLFTLINIVGISESSWMNVLFTLVEISGLILFVSMGIQSPKFLDALSSPISFSTFSATSLVIFAYFGFENIVNFTEEAKDPKKNIPRAILLSMGICVILYLFVAWASLALLPVDQLAQSDAPLAEAVRPISQKIAGALGGIALFATANTVLISLVAASRILLGMGRDKALPKVFTQILAKRKTPWVAAIVSFLVACSLLPIGKVEVLAGITSFSTIIAFLSVHVSLVVLRFKSPKRERPFRVPLSLKSVPIFPVLGVVVSFFLLLQFEKIVYLVGCGFLLGLLGIEFGIRKLGAVAKS